MTIDKLYKLKWILCIISTEDSRSFGVPNLQGATHMGCFSRHLSSSELDNQNVDECGGKTWISKNHVWSKT
jgi:hypothetical protein